MIKMVEEKSVDLNGDGYKESVISDESGDGQYDTVVSDTDGDGQYDTVAMDTSGDGNVDTVAVYYDGDGEIDYVEADISRATFNAAMKEEKVSAILTIPDNLIGKVDFPADEKVLTDVTIKYTLKK